MKHLGFTVANATINNFVDQKVLVVERFDRKLTDINIIRLPQEDMCQALGVVSGSKYQEHGGPGIQQIMKLLKTSNQPMNDQKTFMKSQIVFWLLAAIDGHAKNFSLFLKPNGYSLTPFYDVMSAYPYFGQGNIQKKKIKMAMGVDGKNRHYKWYSIMQRHWLSMAEIVKFPNSEMKNIIDEVANDTPHALDKTMNELPSSFPLEVSDSIYKGVTSTLPKLNTV